MIKKIGGFFEEHVEKIILIIVGLVCAWLLITRVLLTPNVVKYKDETYSPGNIDKEILKRVNKIAGQMDSDLPEINLPEERNYNALLKNPLGDIDVIIPPNSGPGIPPPPPPGKKPVIADVTGVDVEHIRSVVYEPVSEVTSEMPYEDGNCEPNDLDLVTVSAYIDMAKIVDEFERCYKYVEMPDPCKAKPILASVNLQRQRRKADGSWDEWENIPRTKIDYNRDLFKVIESFSDLRFGSIEIYKYQLNRTITQLELLQPEPYQVASAEEEWLPPELHREFLEAQKKDEREARRQETADDTTTSDTGGRRSRGGSTLSTGGIGSSITSTTGTRRGSTRRGTSTDTGGTTSRRSRGRGTTTQPDPVNISGQTELYIDQVYDDFVSIILTNTTDLTKVSEPVLFWAHDDTVQPDNTYKYRIRVGFLNPEAQKDGDQIIFWSDFSDDTSEVYIPGQMYFFALGEVQEVAKTVSVSVYKLALGNWYKKVYDRVGQGEMIGDIEEIEHKESDTINDTTGQITNTDEPDTVDFTTGAVMVDVVRVSDWMSGSSSNPVPYYDMMYTYDGKEILHIPATKRPDSKIWPPDLYKAYIYVQSLINDKHEPFKSWSASEINIEQIRSGQQYNIRVNRQ